MVYGPSGICHHHRPQLSSKGKVQLIFNIPDISGHKGSKIQGFQRAYLALEIAEFGPR